MGWMDKYQDGGIVKDEPMVSFHPPVDFPYDGTSRYDVNDYNLSRAMELYQPDETGHLPSIDNTNGEWLKGRNYPTAWMELMTTQLNPSLYKELGSPKVNEKGKLQYMKGYQDGGIIKDNDGYWNPDNWGKPVEIDSNRITMKGVNQPLIGVSDLGDVQFMQPRGEYKFKGKKVTEIPLAQDGKLLPKAFMYSYLRSPIHDRNIENELIKSDEDGEYNGGLGFQRLQKDKKQVLNWQLKDLLSLKIKTNADSNINRYSSDGVVELSDYMGAGEHEFAHGTQPPLIKIHNQQIELLNKYKPRNKSQRKIKEAAKSTSKPDDSIVGNAYTVNNYLNQAVNKSKEGHDIHPSEVRADIYQLRYNLYNKGVYDPRKDLFTKQHLQKAKQLYNIDGERLKRLFDAYDDNDLIEFMNTVVQNTPQEGEQVMAQQGAKVTKGWMDKYQDGGAVELSGPTIRGKKYPAGIIVTNDPNDPRIQAYQDSLLLSTSGEKKIKNLSSRLTNLGISKTSRDILVDEFRKDSSASDAIQRLEKYTGNKIIPNEVESYTTPVWENGTYISDTVWDISKYTKPKQPVVFEERITPMKSRGVQNSKISPTPRVLPDVIQFDPTTHAAYKGIDITHFTDGQGRWVAKLNRVTTPGVRGRLSTKN